MDQVVGAEVGGYGASDRASAHLDVETLKVAYAAAFRSALRITGDRETTEDIAQEACARLVVHTLRVRSGHDNWTSRVATNLALSEMRRRSVHRRTSAGPRAGGPDQSHTEHEIDLVNAVNGLPRRRREVIALRYFADLPLSEVAVLLGCSAGSVNKHTSRAMKSLRSTLGEGYLLVADKENPHD